MARHRGSNRTRIGRMNACAAPIGGGEPQNRRRWAAMKSILPTKRERASAPAVCIVPPPAQPAADGPKTSTAISHALPQKTAAEGKAVQRRIAQQEPRRGYAADGRTILPSGRCTLTSMPKTVYFKRVSGTLDLGRGAASGV